MNVFKVHRGYRKIGVNYGLPVFFVDMGPGVGYTPEDLIKKLMGMGLREGSWVVIRNNGLKERGVGVLVSGLSYMGVRIEFEDDGKGMTPGWFPQVDRWVVDYIENNIFNYGALRNKIDILLCRGGDIEKFLEGTKGIQALKGVLVGDMDGVWEKVKDYNVRVYEQKIDT